MFDCLNLTFGFFCSSQRENFNFQTLNSKNFKLHIFYGFRFERLIQSTKLSFYQNTDDAHFTRIQIRPVLVRTYTNSKTW